MNVNLINALDRELWSTHEEIDRINDMPWGCSDDQETAIGHLHLHINQLTAAYEHLERQAVEEIEQHILPGEHTAGTLRDVPRDERY